MSEIYSIVFINPGEVDAISDDKVLPPAYRTVQNKQPIPAGSVYKRNALPNTTLRSTPYTTGLQTQLISQIDIKGTGSVEVAIGAIFATTTGIIPRINFYKYDAGTSSWFYLPSTDFVDSTKNTTGGVDASTSFIPVETGHGVVENDMIRVESEKMYVVAASATSLQVKRGVNGTGAVLHGSGEDVYKTTVLGNTTTTGEFYGGTYYVTNALSSSNLNKLITVKYNPSTTRAISPCCYAFSHGYAVTKFDAFGDVDIRTLNWRSAACATFHQSKLWVGGLNEHDYSTFVDSGENTTSTMTIADTNVPIATGHNISATDLIRINSVAAGTGSDEEMYVTTAGPTNLTVIREVNGTVATAHETATDVYKSSGVSSLKRNRVRWSKSFSWDHDINSWTGSGTGFFDFPIVGQNPTVVGLQSFKNRLYVLTNSDLYVISGATSASFGKNEVMRTPGAIGPTLKISDRFMFWVDAVGIHQFNGVEAINVSEKLKPRAFQSLNVDQYNIDGALETGEGRLPTAFVNEKLGIYGVHFPKTSVCDGQVTWLYYYLRGTIETYTYDYVGYNGSYNTAMEDITYVSDYHPSGKVWMGGGNGASATSVCWGGLYSFEPVELGANAEKDWAGTNGISTVIDTGDINLSAIKGGAYEDTSQISHIDIFYVPDVAQDVTLKMDLSIDGAPFNDNVTRTTATLYKDTNGKLAPVKVTMPLPSRRSGAFIRIKLTEDDNDGKVDIRRMDIYYKSSMERVVR
tara:strand:- start:805 stop:3039 length:2235 start_codon:yes stop_codon:yes gene_type:complete